MFGNFGNYFVRRSFDQRQLIASEWESLHSISTKLFDVDKNMRNFFLPERNWCFRAKLKCERTRIELNFSSLARNFIGNDLWADILLTCNYCLRYLRQENCSNFFSRLRHLRLDSIRTLDAFDSADFSWQITPPLIARSQSSSFNCISIDKLCMNRSVPIHTCECQLRRFSRCTCRRHLQYLLRPRSAHHSFRSESSANRSTFTHLKWQQRNEKKISLEWLSWQKKKKKTKHKWNGANETRSKRLHLSPDRRAKEVKASVFQLISAADSARKFMYCPIISIIATINSHNSMSEFSKCHICTDRISIASHIDGAKTNGSEKGKNGETSGADNANRLRMATLNVDERGRAWTKSINNATTYCLYMGIVRFFRANKLW